MSLRRRREDDVRERCHDGASEWSVQVERSRRGADEEYVRAARIAFDEGAFVPEAAVGEDADEAAGVVDVDGDAGLEVPRRGVVVARREGDGVAACLPPSVRLAGVLPKC
jgi:hypothetical protein